MIEVILILTVLNVLLGMVAVVQRQWTISRLSNREDD